MKLTTTFLNNLKLSTDLTSDAKLSASPSTKKEKFEKVMNGISKDTDNNINTKPRKEKPKKSDEITSSPNKVKTNENKTSNKSKGEVDIKVANEEATVNELAENLDITPERVMEILAQLNMTISDLANKPEKFTDFLKEAFNVETSIELLNVADIREVMANMKDILSDHKVPVEASSEISALTANVITETEKVIQTVNNDTSILSEESLRNNNKVEEETTSNIKTSVNKEERVIFSSVPVVGKGESSNNQLLNDNETDMNFINTTTTAEKSKEVKTTFLKTEFGKNINAQDVVKQMLETLKTDVRNGVSEIKIILKPEQLGDITLKLITENGIISAKFLAENERVKEIIESNFNQLKDALEEQGLSISELSVSVGQDDSDERMQHFLREQQKSGARIKQIIDSINGIEEDAENNLAQDLSESNVDFTA